MRKRLVWLALDCLVILCLLLISCAPAAAPATEEKKTETAPPPAQEVVTLPPAEFIISSLSITPSKVKPGEKVTVSTVVTNTGGTEGSYTAILKINETEETKKEIIVGTGKSQTIEFTVVRNSEGNYRVSIEGKTGQFTVSTPAPIVTLPPVVTPPPVPSLSLTDKDVILSNPITYKVTRTVTIRNTGAQIDLVRVWLSLAVAWDSQTNVTTDATTPASTSTWQDSQSGNKVLFWELRGQPASGSSITLTDEFTYTCHQISCEVDPNRIGTYNKTSSDYQFYTRSEKYIESDNAQIKEISGRLQQDKTNPYAVAGAIYDWVMNSLTYRTVGGLKGAKFALDNKYGECGDYSALFVALCRAAGIPARPVVGRWATSSPADWHVWAEFYLPGYGWLPVDPTDADLNGKGRANFGNLDNKRLILHKGFNITLQPKPIFLEPETGILQTLTWEWRGTGGQVQTELTYTINQK